MIKSMLTTIDNPYDPFDEFDSWYLFDVVKGYNTCQYLARIAKTSEELSSAEYEAIMSSAIDEIIRLDFMKIYKKVTKEEKGFEIIEPEK